MDRERLNGIIDAVNKERQGLMIGKGQDYANEDALANFKRLHSLCVILDIDPRRSAADCTKFLMMLKIDRWCNLTKSKKTPSNESIRDTILDLHNYIDLAFACEIEESSNDRVR